MPKYEYETRLFNPHRYEGYGIKEFLDEWGNLGWRVTGFQYDKDTCLYHVIFMRDKGTCNAKG